jgi:hypothetical protein
MGIFRDFIAESLDGFDKMKKPGTGRLIIPKMGNQAQNNPTPVSTSPAELSPEQKLLNKLGFPRWPKDGDRAYVKYRGESIGKLANVRVEVLDRDGQIANRPRILAKVVPLQGVSDKEGAWGAGDEVHVGYDDVGLEGWKWHEPYQVWICPADYD